ncbi:hypothetical protein [Mycolicibacterium litorale]|uniref:Uncharacterized protein n=1 Tax=Mycolicibacterium litorale TaxID=758802 RepID=A0AAD1MU23_9MYCO|nr:hypothetical protein [Mycolicibacterium litorale]MCV7418817.1 hypothetical protein [Mycolicibacterium litorale]TDY00401.1 hypothetical protein BCL50_5258 [Mycolicibacterium litorale]BBY15766.1 hypothetical protein MLIT_13580 [Mycolicibacterium litorale]
MALHPHHATRFGWRLWLLLPEYWRLLTPHGRPKAAMCSSSLVDARCPHGNAVPSSDCACGVHYIADLDAFRDYCGHYLDQGHMELFGQDYQTWRLPIAATFGVACGPVERDRKVLDALRTDRYRILAAVVPTTIDGDAQQQIRRHYRVPVLDGLTGSACSAVASAMSSTVSEHDLQRYAQQPATPPDELTLQWNATIQRRPFRAFVPPRSALPQHVQAMLERDKQRRRAFIPELPAELATP